MKNLNHSNKEIYNRDCYNPVKENFMAFSYSERDRTRDNSHNVEKWWHPTSATPIADSSKSASLDFKSNADTEKLFNELVAKWKDETGLFSTTYDKIINDTFLEIIGLGKGIVRLILQDLKYEGGHWHTALKALTGENPVPNEYLRNSKKIREVWLAWGAGKDLI